MDNKLTKYILKNQKRNDKNLKYDFMPSLLEIIERPSHIAGTVITITIAMLLIIAVLWSAFSKIDIVINGMGNLLPEGKVVELQPLVASKVKSIEVKVGDYVEAGDTLLFLDNDATQLDRQLLEYNIEWCKIKLAISKERLKNDEYVISIQDYNSKFSDGLNQLALDIELYIAQKEQRQKDLEKAQKDLDDAKAANNNSFLPTLEERVVSYAATITSSDKSQQSQMYSQIFGLEQELQEYEVQLKKLNLTAESYIIKTPVNGYVNMISVVSPQQTVSPGNVVAAIVPSDETMEFECYIADKDRAEIAVGKDVTIKLAAYSFSDYGIIRGKVTYISPSAFANEKLGNVYVVDIKIDQKGINPKIELISGLSGNVEIIVGKRSILQYFLEPITGGLRNSLKEP